MDDFESTIVGHKRQEIDPEKQIEFIRNYLRGKEIREYGGSINTIIQIARMAVERAGNNANLLKKITRLEGLVKKKLSGEEISSDDIDNAESQEEKPVSQKELGTEIDEENEVYSFVIPEVAEIDVLINDVINHALANEFTDAKEKMKQIEKKISEATDKGIDLEKFKKIYDDFNQLF